MTKCSNCKEKIKGKTAYKDRKALCHRCFELLRETKKVRVNHFGWLK